MVYSPQMRKAIGLVRAAFDDYGFGRQSDDYRKHGMHGASLDAPLVLVACSGGRDSLALAVLAHIVAGMNGVRCGAVVVDHGIQRGSAEVAKRAAQQCESLGLAPVAVRKVSVDARNGGQEAAARGARYAALTDEARNLGASAVLIAHTQDDQAETVLLAILRSSSPSAVAGMPDRFSRDGILFARPLLECTREDTTQICQQNGLEWWDDPTNGDEVEGSAAGSNNAGNLEDIPLRSQVRQRVMPVLKDLGGQAVLNHFSSIAQSIREDQDYLERLARETLDQAEVELLSSHQRVGGVVEAVRVEQLSAAPAPLRRRCLRLLLNLHGAQPSRAVIERVDALVMSWHGQARVKVSSEFSVRRQKHVIELCQDRTHANS